MHIARGQSYSPFEQMMIDMVKQSVYDSLEPLIGQANMPNQNGNIYSAKIYRALMGFEHLGYENVIMPEPTYTESIEEDAPAIVKIMAPLLDHHFENRPANWNREEMIEYRMNPKNRFPWAIEPRNDWELITLKYLKKRLQDKRKMKELYKLFKDID